MASKVFRYDKAIRSLVVHNEPITSGADARILPGVGPKIAEKIQEIIDTVSDSNYSEVIVGYVKAVGRSNGD